MVALSREAGVSVRGGLVAIGVGVVLVALNLRAGITSLGALLDLVAADLGFDGVHAGLLTTLPVVAFAVVGGVTPILVRHVGLVGGLLVASAALLVGLAVRATAASSLQLLAWTALAMAGIAVANVLLPSAVKRFFPERLGLMTGLYTMAMQLGSALAAGTSAPIAEITGSWRIGLGTWALLAACGLLPWVFAWRSRPHEAPTTARRAASTALARNPVAWALAVFFGSQSLAAYVVMGWVPEIYRSAGISSATAGLLLAVIMAFAAPIALLLPSIANRFDDQRPLVVAVTTAMAGGWLGLMLAPAEGAWLWAVLLGIGSGAFPLALALIGLRAHGAEATTSLSAFAQSVGYVIAVAGPLAVGTLHEVTGGWGLPLGMLCALLVPQLVAGLVAGRRCDVGSPAPGRPHPAG